MRDHLRVADEQLRRRNCKTVAPKQWDQSLEKMAVRDMASLFGKVLVLVAHQDDEVACSVLLQRAGNANVVFATDGAPRSAGFWSRYGSREEYVAIRHAEALRALAAIGTADPIFLEDPLSHVPFIDQELFRSLAPAFWALLALTCRVGPDALLTPAYEGGHPDHDACSFLVSSIGSLLSIPRWEMPLYHRSPQGILVHQQFRIPLGGEILLNPTPREFDCREEMIGKYVSQPGLRNWVTARVERFRPQPKYDYSRPPHSGKLNYEAWEWPMSGSELCMAFSACAAAQAAAAFGDSEPAYAWAGCTLKRAESVTALQS